MLGLAVALSTFGLGVIMTTLWISRYSPQPRETDRRMLRHVLVAEPSALLGADETTPCEAARSKTAVFYGEPISGGVLNGKALRSPRPLYPDVARSAQVSGEVIVEITVDECGNVVSAKAVYGHPLLQMSAVQAAYKWRFSPTLLSGQPVKVRGTLSFNFLMQ
jgi:TonB family protein